MEFLYFLEGIRTSLGDAFFSLITHLGEETLFIAFALIFFWCVDKYRGYYLLVVGFCGTVFNQFLKMAFRIPRPWVIDPEFSIVESARAEATGYSFPSGHTQSSVGLYGGIARSSARRVVQIGGVVLCALIALSRMYLGVHTPKDVLVSVAIGTLLVLAFYPIVEKSRENSKLMYILIAFNLVITVANLLFVELYPFPTDVDPVNLANAVDNAYKMLGAVLGVCLLYPVEHKWICFETKAVWWAQILKFAGGLALVVAVKALLKYPLNAVFGASAGNCIRYFLMVVVAGLLWPLTFKFFARLGRNKSAVNSSN